METQLQLASLTQHRMRLTKFSFATTSEVYHGPIPWQHLTSEWPLSAIFELSVSQDTIPKSSEGPRFRILNDRNVLVRCESESPFMQLTLVGGHQPKCLGRGGPASSLEGSCLGQDGEKSRRLYRGQMSLHRGQVSNT